MENASAAVNRRAFITRSAKSLGGLVVLGASPSSLFATVPNSKQFTVQEVMDLILKEGGLTPIKDTVDVLKAGQADQVVTGIVTTMFPTIPVIEEAARRNANFLIVHEPSFYNHRDDAGWMSDNAVQVKKKELLRKHGIAVWRFHDYCHSLRPDAVRYGVAQKMNWLPYLKEGQDIIAIPAASLKQLVQYLKSSLNIAHLRLIGDLTQSCERIALMPGAAGGRRHITMVEVEKPDVLIVGEAPEWETVEYIRDARALGGKTALIILGHAVSEEPDMRWLSAWLQPKLEGVTISHVASGDPFAWM